MFYYIYIIKQDIRIYMLSIAGQTAGPIGLTFFVDTHGGLGVLQLKFELFLKIFFFQNIIFQIFFHGKRALQPVENKSKIIDIGT